MKIYYVGNDFYIKLDYFYSLLSEEKMDATIQDDEYWLETIALKEQLLKKMEKTIHVRFGFLTVFAEHKSVAKEVLEAYEFYHNGKVE